MDLTSAHDSMERAPGAVRHSLRFHDKNSSTLFQIQEDPTDGARYPPFAATTSQKDRLPPEILAAIFVHLSEPDSSEDERSGFVQDLFSVTHVCRFWRQVAINAPELWSEITTTSLEIVETFLERSKTVPLNVYFRPVNQKILRSVAPHTHRFRQLTVSAPRFPGPEPFASLTNPAPLLETLVISCPADLQPRILFDDQAPRLRELLVFTTGLWLKNQLGNLTSLHLTFFDIIRPSEFLPFFDMLRRCPVLEEMFVRWNLWDVVPATSIRPPTIPFPRLRKLLLHSFYIQNIEYLLQSFEFMTDEIAIHLSDVSRVPEDEHLISRIQTVFPDNNPRQPSLLSSTKLELIMRTTPPGIVLHAIGPRFSVRLDTSWEDHDLPSEMNLTLHDVFPSVDELWIRGLAPAGTEIDGFEHFPALVKLVLEGSESKLVRNIRQALSPDDSGILPSPLLSSIDYYGGDESEMRDIFLLIRNRCGAGHRLETLRVPSSFTPLLVDIGGCVQDVASLGISSGAHHMHSMDLPEYCFAEGHGWWEPWE